MNTTREIHRVLGPIGGLPSDVLTEAVRRFDVWADKLGEEGMRPAPWGAWRVCRLIGRRGCHGSAKCPCSALRPFIDHACMFNRNGRAELFVAQPYEWREDQVGPCRDFAAAHGLDFTFDEASSWHYPGRTVMLTFRRPQQQEVS